jgi:hypothetical protein
MESAMGVYRTSWVGLVLLAGLAGCNWAPAPPAGTGARETAQAYCEALVQRDWQQAYAALHPDSQKRCTQEQFTRLAQAYRRNLGFEPEEVQVRSCGERGTEAIAHVVLTGRASSQARRYKDGVTLRQTVEGWRVVLPPSFGRQT